MARLPLFPLNTVLFPGMQIKLHIFEARYKLMINQCIDANEPFGIVLIKQGSEALGPASAPFSVGCTAAISEVQRLPLGRMNITAVGQRRFCINAIERSSPFLLGDVDFFSPSEDEPELVQRYGAFLRALILRYLKILSSSEDASFDPERIPHRPRTVAQIASILLQTDNAQKQELLSMRSLSRLLATLVEIYRLETVLLNVRLSPPDKDFNIGPFSRN
ncbi:MAG: LON peptidase substrate-binding domain-containing protein [Chloroflexota bacterium]|nr:LON peptidase substrate-binding domain-containing protein [Chloroflexota bacterium]MDE2947072.1 LON peptidase substrate-binding domain-containing protein [Chloroflexota bacterium]